MATNAARVGRNELCSCGSGKKYKKCCGTADLATEDTASRFFGVAAVLAGLMLVGGIFVWGRELFFTEPPKRVWSAEHGHYHEVGGGEHASSEGGPGKVWSEEHGHYHEAASAAPGDLHAPSPNKGALDALRESELDAASKKAQ